MDNDEDSEEEGFMKFIDCINVDIDIFCYQKYG